MRLDPLRFRRRDPAGDERGLLRAETELAAVQLLTDFLLTSGSKRDSATLGLGFRSVATWAVWAGTAALALGQAEGEVQLPAPRPIWVPGDHSTHGSGTCSPSAS